MDQQRSGVNPPTIDRVVYIYTWTMEKVAGLDINDVLLHSVELPTISFNVESVKTTVEYKVASSLSPRECRLSFYDVNDISKKLVERINKIWSPKEGLQPANEYVGESIISVYYANGQLAAKWCLKNSWIKSLSFSRLTYTRSDVNLVNVVLAYSWPEKTY